MLLITNALLTVLLTCQNFFFKEFTMLSLWLGTQTFTWVTFVYFYSISMGLSGEEVKHMPSLSSQTVFELNILKSIWMTSYHLLIYFKSHSPLLQYLTCLSQFKYLKIILFDGKYGSKSQDVFSLPSLEITLKQ